MPINSTEMESPLELPEGTSPANTLISALVDSFWTSDLHVLLEATEHVGICYRSTGNPCTPRSG